MWQRERSCALGRTGDALVAIPRCPGSGKVVFVRRRLPLALLILLASFAVCSCSRSGSEEESASGSRDAGGESGWREPAEDTSPSEAARSQGVPPHTPREDSEEARPQIAVRGFSYEWRLEPEKGLHVSIHFVNTRETYERARGYLFLVATSASTPSAPQGVYPWDARFEEGVPEKHTDGNRLLFREDLEARAFIPFAGGDGYYDHLRIVVYREDGGTAIDLDYDLAITGEPTGPVEAEPQSVTM